MVSARCVTFRWTELGRTRPVQNTVLSGQSWNALPASVAKKPVFLTYVQSAPARLVMGLVAVRRRADKSAQGAADVGDASGIRFIEIKRKPAKFQWQETWSSTIAWASFVMQTATTSAARATDSGSGGRECLSEQSQSQRDPRKVSRKLYVRCEIGLALRWPRAGRRGPEEDLMLSIHPQARTTPAVRRRSPARPSPPACWPSAIASRHRDHPQVAQARGRRLPGPLQPAAQAALESHRGGAGHRLRPAPRHRLSAR